jgi:hypothetical protein
MLCGKYREVGDMMTYYMLLRIGQSWPGEQSILQQDPIWLMGAYFTRLAARGVLLTDG